MAIGRKVVSVYTDHPGAATQEFGAASRRPKSAQYLHFEIDGQEIFTKEVSIPASPHWRPAMQSAKGTVLTAMSGAWMQAVRRSIR